MVIVLSNTESSKLKNEGFSKIANTNDVGLLDVESDLHFIINSIEFY